MTFLETVFAYLAAIVLGLLSSLAVGMIVGKRLKKQRERFEREEQARIDSINEQIGGRDG